ncbi:MAG: prepilin-type N-terminal cleavage/methylation domain-containing protein [Deltaproteobacteria bacterium]|nr:prepilin-type N-terminal cleavage/methylation domain-containing protein [Deltaproteobacteria bacterium]
MKNNGGMTLVEVLVSLAIVFIVFLGLNSAGLVVLDQNIKNSQRDEGVNVAEMEMRAVRNIPFTSLPVTDNTITYSVPPRTIRSLNVPYTVTRTIRYLDAQNREVTILVSWNRLENRQTRTYTHQETTVVRQP